MQQDKKQSAPRMLVSITPLKNGSKLEKIFDILHIPIYYQCRGKGTAPSELMDIFGLGGSTRVLTLVFVPKFQVKELFDMMKEKLFYNRRGGGIAVTVPITGLQNPVHQVMMEGAKVSMEKLEKLEGERTDRDMADIQKKSEYTMIWISVVCGYSDDAIDAAREAGARGGTVLRGRRRNSEHMSQHLGISMQDEQEFVMIITRTENKNKVMDALCKACGLRTPAHGVVFSLPVDEAIGLEE
ncbi:MAG: transcriptional regulator [Eubacteriales bacterium]|nr:transcriptional regulator [Eubacteriales bacterium]